MKKQLVICGGGNSAHTLIPLLSQTDFEVSVLTSRPNAWGDTIDLDYVLPDGTIAQSIQGKVKMATNNPFKCIPNADYVVLCMPVHKYRVALHNIAPFVNRVKQVVIGTVYGQGGFNWMVDEIKKQYRLTNIVTFAFGLIPWVCRTIEYGHKGVTYGFKAINGAAVFPFDNFAQLNEELFNPICYNWFKVGKTEPLGTFLSITLAVDNQIIHPTRCYALSQQYPNGWHNVSEVPMFYRDYNQYSADCLSALDDDYTKVRSRLMEMYPNKDWHYMLNYLDLDRYTNQYEPEDIVDSFVSSPKLGAIGTPVVADDNGIVNIDTNCRFFTDDIYYGICITKWIAEQLSLDVPMIDKILRWAQEIRDERIISDENRLILDSIDLCSPMKSGIPFYYGITKIEDIIA